jgi:hypothetical protein
VLGKLCEVPAIGQTGIHSRDALRAVQEIKLVHTVDADEEHMADSVTIIQALGL